MISNQFAFAKARRAGHGFEGFVTVHICTIPAVSREWQWEWEYDWDPSMLRVGVMWTERQRSLSSDSQVGHDLPFSCSPTSSPAQQLTSHTSQHFITVAAERGGREGRNALLSAKCRKQAQTARKYVPERTSTYSVSPTSRANELGLTPKLDPHNIYTLRLGRHGQDCTASLACRGLQHPARQRSINESGMFDLLLSFCFFFTNITPPTTPSVFTPVPDLPGKLFSSRAMPHAIPSRSDRLY